MKIYEFMEMHIAAEEQVVVIWVNSENAYTPLYEGLYEDMPEDYQDLELETFYISETTKHKGSGVLALDVSEESASEIVGSWNADEEELDDAFIEDIE